MRGAVLHGPRDVGFEEYDTPKIVAPTDALAATSVFRRVGVPRLIVAGARTMS